MTITPIFFSKSTFLLVTCWLHCLLLENCHFLGTHLPKPKREHCCTVFSPARDLNIKVYGPIHKLWALLHCLFKSTFSSKWLKIAAGKFLNLKGVSGLKVFLLCFLPKNFDRSEIWAFYDHPLPRYNRIDFPFRKAFPLRKFARVANYEQNFKKLLHVSYSQ